MKKEIKINKNEEYTLFALSIASLFGKNSDKLPEDVDFDKVLQESREQSVLAAAFEGAYLLGAELTHEVFSKYLRTAAAISASNEQLLCLQDEAIALLEAENIPYCVIKGASVSMLYDNPALRTMGDVDLIVRECDYSRAQQIFSESFKVIGEDGSIHSEYEKNGKIIELHKSINGLPENDIGKDLEKFFGNITENSINLDFDGHVFKAPSPVYTGVVLLLHTYEHLTAGGIGLRHLFDFLAFSEKYLNEENYENAASLIRVFDSFGIANFAANLVYCMGLLPGFESLSGYSWIHEYNLGNREELLLDILEGGNFGRKKYEERYISEIIVKDGGKDRGFFGRIFHNFIEVAKSSMPIVKKYPILYPVAFIYIPIRYVFRVITGKRTAINPVKMVRSSKDRYEIYGKFNMFRK